MKIFRYILFLVFLSFLSFGSNAQVYYWVGGTGNWNDALHWSNTSNGVPNAGIPPTSNSIVVFDANSFTTNGQTVTVDTSVINVKAIFWNLDSTGTIGVPATVFYNPTFLNSNSTDSIKVKGSFVLHPSMTYSFNGPIKFTGGSNDSIVPAGKIFGGNVIIDTYGNNLKIKGNLTSNGNFIFKRGGLYINNIVISTLRFDSNYSGTKNLYADNTIFNISGADTVISVKPMTTLNGTNRVFNITNSSTQNYLSIGMGGIVQDWGTLNLQNKNVRFITDSYFNTIAHVNSIENIEIIGGKKLKCNVFNIDGNCGKYINFTGISTQATLDNLSDWNIDFFKLKNLKCNLALPITATNTIDLGNNLNWTISADNTAPIAMYWIGGQGNFYDGSHWSFTSGGAASNCIPTPNDTVYFNAPSFNNANDTLFIMQDVRVATVNFSGLDVAIVLKGGIEKFILTKNLYGSSNLSYNWNGRIDLTGSTSCTIQTGIGGSWGCNIYKLGSGTLTFLDDFISSENLYHQNGEINTNGKNVTLFSFNSSHSTQSRNLNFLNSTFNIKGTEFTVSPNNLVNYHTTGSTFNFVADSLMTLFTPGTDSLHVVNLLNGSSVQIEETAVKYHSLLNISPGSTLILKNSSQHEFNELSAVGTCDSLVTIKSNNTTYGPATFGHKPVWSNVMNVDYALIDNVTAGAGSPYQIDNSIISTSSTGWLSGTGYNTTSVGFLIVIPNDTISQGETTPSIISTSNLTIPANASIITSVLTLDGIQLTGATTLSNCLVSATGSSTLASTVLTSYSAPTIQVNTTTLPGANGIVNLVLSQNAGPVGNFIIDTAYLTVSYYLPYKPVKDTLYWFGGTGDWSDVDHWSYNSGNVPPNPATCVPSFGDNVIFDNLSFSANNQNVTVDNNSYFANMTWELVDDSVYLHMNEDLTAFESVALSSFLKVDKGIGAGKLKFQPNDTTAYFDQHSAFLDVNLEFISTDLNDTLDFENNVDNGNFNSIIVYGGVLNTNGFDLHSNSFLITSAFTPSKVNLENSILNLVAGYSDYAGSSSVVNAGTSTISVNSSNLVSTNYFRGNSQTFNKVELNLNPNNYSIFSGSNAFDTLIVGAGSKLTVDSLSNNTINDVFTMRGTCVDSIFLKSSGIINNYTFTSSAILDAMCLNVRKSTATAVASGTFVTYFSTNGPGNTGAWNFDVTPATTAVIDNLSNFCLGDTLSFGNASTAFQNDLAGLSYNWNFGDGESFNVDTTMHFYNYPGIYYVELSSTYTNLCKSIDRDTIEIFAPSVSFTMSAIGGMICAEAPISFYANSSEPAAVSSFEYIINGVPVDIPTIDLIQFDTLNLPNPSLISVNLYENGCQVSSDTLTLQVIPLDIVTISSPSTAICAGQSVVLTPGGSDVYQYYKNGVAITPFTTLPYSTTSIVNGDAFYVIGRNNTTMCSDTSNILTFTVNALPTITSFTSNDLDNIICANDTVLFTVTSATAISYQFYINGALNATTAVPSLGIPNIPNAGQVNAIVVNAAGCSSLPSGVINHLVNPVPNTLITSTEATANICEGTNVLFTASNANLYQYFVNGAPIGPMGSNAFYETDTLNNNDLITVSGSSFGCIGNADTIAFTVVNSPITTLSSDLGNSICLGDLVTLTATSAIATNYEFIKNGTTLYNGSLNALSLSNLTNNDLITVVGSASGCSFTDNIVFTVNNNPTASIFTNDANNTLCQGQSITFTGTGGNSYEYFVNGLSALTSVGTYTTDTLSAGNNTIYIIATNTVTGCSSSSNNVIVNNIELPITNLTSTSSSVCAGQSVIFTATSAVADNYQFFVNSVSQGLPSVNNTFTSSSLPNGAIIFVRGYNDGCVNPGEDTITMIVSPNPTASITGSAIFCEGTSQIYTGNSTIIGSTFEFFVDGTSQSTSSTFDASGLASGNYVLNLVVTSPNGCTDNELLTISVIQNPIVSLIGNSTICSGESVTFAGTGALNYQFFVNGLPTSTNSTFTTSTLANGDIVTLSGTTGASCSALSTTQITMNVSPTPTVTLISDDADNILCTGNTVIFTAAGGNNYQFFINGNSQGAPSTLNTFTTTSLTNGQTVTVQGESNGCIDLSTSGITFSVSNSPVVSLVNLEDTVLCTDTQTQLVASGANDYLFYLNGTPQGVFGPGNTFNVLLNNGDIVSVEGMTNTCVSSANSNYEFSVFNYPTTSLLSSDPDNTICYGDAVTFTGSGATDYEYFIDGISLGLSGAVYLTDQLLNGQTITLIGYNSECATPSPQSLNFTVNTLDLNTTATPTNFMVCEGTPFELQASGADEYEVFVNNASQGAQSTNSTFILTNLNDGDVVTLNGYSSATGCTQSDDQTIFIQVYPEPSFTNSGSTVLCDGDSVILTSNSPNGNQWYLDGIALPNETDSTLIVHTSGVYSIETTHGGNGELYSVGYNSNGEFGDGSNLNNMYPSLAENITNVLAISTGINHTLIVDGAGQLMVFGDNASGQLGNGTYTATNTPIAITTVPNIVDVAAGENSSLVVTNTGEMFSWGDNNDGQLGLGNTIVFNTPQWVVGMTGFTKVSAGKTHFIALKNDGTVWSVGNNDFGQLGNGTNLSNNVFTQIPGLTNIAKIAAGDYHSMAIDNAGSLYVWGNNGSGQLGLNDLNSRTSPTLSGLTNVIAVAGGNSHTLFVTENNRAYSAGANNFGQLGTGNLVSQDSPIHLTDIDAVVDVAAGRHHSLFLKNDGTVWGTGRNDNKQLGNLPLTSIQTISQIDNVEGVTIIDGGNQSSHFVFGNSTTCVSNSSTITVNSAPQPVITYLSGTLSTTATGISYEWFIDDIEIVNSNAQSIVLTANGDYSVAVTYANGCISTSEIFTYPIVGIDENSMSFVKLAPNPTNGKFTINWSSGLAIDVISIYDLTGKLIENFKIDNSTTESHFDLSDYSNGVYTIRVSAASGWNKTLRVIKN